jgi:hypothetical protein
MTSSQDNKLIVVPEELVKELREIANRLGISISNYTTDALTQAIRANKLKATLDEVVDIYQLVKIREGAGSLSVPRSTLNQLLEIDYHDIEEIQNLWFEAGRWYGEYLNTKLGEEEALSFLEKDLKLSWNLDEVEINNSGYEASIRCASFMMTQNLTNLLLSYLSGVMFSLNYDEVDRDYLRGMAFLKYNKNMMKKEEL